MFVCCIVESTDRGKSGSERLVDVSGATQHVSRPAGKFSLISILSPQPVMLARGHALCYLRAGEYCRRGCFALCLQRSLQMSTRCPAHPVAGRMSCPGLPGVVEFSPISRGRGRGDGDWRGRAASPFLRQIGHQELTGWRYWRKSLNLNVRLTPRPPCLLSSPVRGLRASRVATALVLPQWGAAVASSLGLWPLLSLCPIPAKGRCPIVLLKYSFVHVSLLSSGPGGDSGATPREV